MKLSSFLSLAVALVTFAGAASAEIKTQVVEYRHGDVVLEGLVAWDDTLATAQKPAPGIVVCPEWWGNNEYSRGRARQLAALGYVAMSIDMYGKGQVTTDPKVAGEWSGGVMKDVEVARARARAGYDQLAARPEVDKKRMGVMGYCMGGTVSLELARSGAPLSAIVVFHAGSLLARGDEKAATEANSRIRGLLTVCHGQDDAFVPAGDVDRFHAQMKAAKVDYQFIAYAGAVHAFTNPNADKAGIPGVAYDARADRRSWETMKATFAEAFAR